MADIFISYKSERRAAAEHLAEILADYGYSVWWDYGLISGRDFGAEIEKELRAAKAVIVLWCSMAVGSEWVREEAALAKRLDKIIPTTIEKIQLPLGFSLSQTLDLCDWDGAPRSNRLDRLLRDVGQLVGRPATPNLEGLERTERAWRRFGGPPLREFALTDALERQLPARTLPTALSSPQAPPHIHNPKPKSNRSALIIAGIVVVVALGAGWAIWAARHTPQAGITRSAHVETPPASTRAETDAPLIVVTTDHPIVQPLLGHWRWSETMACKDGPDVAKRGADRLVFTTPGSVFVHVLTGVVADGPEKGRVRTTIEEPEALKGTRYELRLTDGILNVHQIGEQKIDTWTRCTP